MKQYKLGVSGLIYAENKILLIRREKAPYLNKWTLPGGSVELNETINQAIQRELLEEVGLFVKITNNSFLSQIPNKQYFIVTKLCIPIKETQPKEQIVKQKFTIDQLNALDESECTPFLQLICKLLLEQHEQ